MSLLTTSLLDDKHPALKTSALSLAMNISSSTHKIRMNKYTANSSPTNLSMQELPDDQQVELLASLLEILSLESPFSEEKKMALICIGWLVYGAEMDGELRDLWRVMTANETVGALKGKAVEDRLLVKEIKALLEV